MAATELLDALLARAQALNEGLRSGAFIREAVVNRDNDVLELQRLQLFQGRASSGDDIRPYYSEDVKPTGYFHSNESAARYAAWKQNAVPYPVSAERNPDAPNLYVDGTFHSEIEAQFGEDAMTIVGSTANARRIIAKYGADTFGLTAENWERIFRERGALDALAEVVRKTIER